MYTKCAPRARAGSGHAGGRLEGGPRRGHRAERGAVTIPKTAGRGRKHKRPDEELRRQNQQGREKWGLAGKYGLQKE